MANTSTPQRGQKLLCVAPAAPSTPNNVEEPPYTYIFVAMEPSGNWLRTEAEGRRRVSEGYVNFSTQMNDHILVYAIRKYVLREE